MFKRIGTGESGKPLVLCELNDTEHDALEVILRLATLDLNKYPLSARRESSVRAMISGLCESFEVGEL